MADAIYLVFSIVLGQSHIKMTMKIPLDRYELSGILSDLSVLGKHNILNLRDSFSGSDRATYHDALENTLDSRSVSEALLVEFGGMRLL